MSKSISSGQGGDFFIQVQLGVLSLLNTQYSLWNKATMYFHHYNENFEKSWGYCSRSLAKSMGGLYSFALGVPFRWMWPCIYKAR